MIAPERLWTTRHPLQIVLYPLSLVYLGVVTLRRFFFKRFFQRQHAIPIIVVGNLTVGGVGKTPLVIALTNALQAKGLRVGIVSRGYGSKAPHYPFEVRSIDTASVVGDEPLLLARKTTSPVVIDPNRNRAVSYLCKKHVLDVIISDDGLQHYAMGRLLNIVVVDGLRGFGNGLCLPAGPLRESSQQLLTADCIVVNGVDSTPLWLAKLLNGRPHTPPIFFMSLNPGLFTPLLGGEALKASELAQPVAAMAGIGHPERFFNALTSLGLTFRAYPFADHHPFSRHDLCFEEKTVVMTEKDAVKCEPLATSAMMYLPVEAQLSRELMDAVLKRLTLCVNNYQKD